MPRLLPRLSIALAAFGLAAITSLGGAQAASCASFGKVKSQNFNTPVTVTFVNKSGEYRSVMWIDFKGQPVTYANLNPGQSYTINTYVTHPWMFHRRTRELHRDVHAEKRCVQIQHHPQVDGRGRSLGAPATIWRQLWPLPLGAR